jgi:hypothetical protein
LVGHQDSLDDNVPVSFETLISIPSLQRMATLRVPAATRLKSSLFLDREQGQLVLIVEFLSHRKDYSFKVYTVEYPPVRESAAVALVKADGRGEPPFLVGIGVGIRTLLSEKAVPI